MLRSRHAYALGQPEKTARAEPARHALWKFEAAFRANCSPLSRLRSLMIYGSHSSVLRVAGANVTRQRLQALSDALSAARLETVNAQSVIPSCPPTAAEVSVPSVSLSFRA